MVKENELVGAILIYRQEVRPFTDKQIELVTTLTPCWKTRHGFARQNSVYCIGPKGMRFAQLRCMARRRHMQQSGGALQWSAPTPPNHARTGRNKEAAGSNS
jgi:hypothetical protein